MFHKACSANTKLKSCIKLTGVLILVSEIEKNGNVFMVWHLKNTSIKYKDLL